MQTQLTTLLVFNGSAMNVRSTLECGDLSPLSSLARWPASEGASSARCLVEDARAPQSGGDKSPAESGDRSPHSKAAASARRLAVVVVWFLAAANGYAQFVADGATVTLSNATNSFTGDVTIGTNGSFTSLVLSNDTLLTNSANGVIGRNNTAKSNEVRLLTPTSRWRMGGTLFVGSNGIASRLLVSNGALIESGSLTVGNHSAGSNNEAIVTGPGSTLNAPGLMFVGADGNANRLTILNGGKVFVTNAGSAAFVGFNQGIRNNSALIADPGSRWSVNGTVVVGSGASASTLVVSNGAFVDSLNGTIGSALSASNNLAMVTGAGSAWTNSGILRVGDIGPNSRLIVSNGGSVFAGAVAFVGLTSFSAGNRVTVDGAGSLWQNPGELRVGNSGAGNRLDVSNGGTVASGLGIVGVSSNNNVVSVTGAGSSWSSATNLIVGLNGSANRLQVDDGAMVTASNATLGLNAGANANSALVSGAGSKWLVASSLLVGSNGANASLVISNGATMFVGGHSTVGQNNTATSNSVLVTGSGTSWTVVSNLYVGSNGPRSRLFLTGGARLNSGGGEIGSGFLGGNMAVLDGAGSVWSNRTRLNVGNFSPSNQLLVANGARLDSANSFVGANPGGYDNEAVVTGPGSEWNNSGFVVVGASASGNRLVVSNAARLTSGAGSIGNNSGGASNQILVTGAGSSWINTDLIVVGDLGTGNRLTVRDNAEVSTHRLFLGLDPLSASSALTVESGSLRATSPALDGILHIGRGTNLFNAGLIETDFLLLTNAQGHFEFNGGTLLTRGATISNNNFFIVGAFGTTPAVWDIRPGPAQHVVGELFVGENRAFNQLRLSGGARLSSIECFLGHLGNSPNLAMVTGAGSLWTNAQDLYIGFSSPSNQFLVSDGATVDCRTAEIGINASSNNLAVVTGTGSSWINRGELHVGEDIGGNRLIISGGGMVSARAERIIGNSGGANSNLVLVTDPGSRWIGSADIYVGDRAALNQLIITNGGFVEALNGSTTIGSSLGGDRNQLLVTGAGSILSNQFDVLIGGSGSANSLTIDRGGSVFDARGLFGFGSSSSNNAALVSGAGSLWHNSDILVVGQRNNGNRLTIRNGGTVEDSSGFVGNDTFANNVVIVADPGSVWKNFSNLRVGSGTANQLFVTNGGTVLDVAGAVGVGSASRSNLVVVTGPGSLWANDQTLVLGEAGRGNSLIVSAGGIVRDLGGVIGQDPSSSNNMAVVTDATSSWSNELTLLIGKGGRGNQLFVNNGGSVSAANKIEIGSEETSTNNRVTVSGGILQVTNVERGILEVRRGTNVLNAGLIDATVLLMTNRLGSFEFNGGLLVTRAATISNSTPLVVGGPGGVPATWDVRAGTGAYQIVSSILIGTGSGFNRLLVTNGATLASLEGFLGQNSGGNSNLALIAGPGSRWTMTDEAGVGLSGSFNSLVVSNGGSLASIFMEIGINNGSGDNRILVTGDGSLWNNKTELHVGRSGSRNALLIRDGATVSGGDAVTVGFTPAASSNNLLHVAGGKFFATNGTATATLDIQSGTNRFDAGVMEVDRLKLTDARGFFEFNGGTLRSAGTTSGTGRPFIVGNGVSDATFELLDGSHVFLGGLTVAPHGLLTGNGTITGGVTVQAGGTLAPGPSFGVLTFASAPLLQGTTMMEVSRNGIFSRNDDIQVTTTITYGGSLVVTNIGPTALSEGDEFLLFEAGGFAGAFATISLPPLASGLSWTNKLLVDGSIAVIATPQPRFEGVTLSGTNLILSGTGGPSEAAFTVLTATNVAEPLTNWVSFATNRFGLNGEFQFTNPVNAGELQRYFRLQTP